MKKTLKTKKINRMMLIYKRYPIIFSIVIGLFFGYLLLSPVVMIISDNAHSSMDWGQIQRMHGSFLVSVREVFHFNKLMLLWSLSFAGIGGIIGILAGINSKQLIRYNESLEQKVIERTQALIKTKDYLQHIIDNIGDELLIIDTKFKLTEVNKTLLLKHSFTKDQVIGKHCYMVSHGRNIICQEPNHYCPVTEVINNKKAIVSTHIHQGPNGESLYVEISAAPLFNEEGEVERIVEVSRDITDRRVLEQELAKAKNRLEAIFAGMGEGLSIVNRDRKIIMVNGIVEDIFGDNIIGKTCREAYRREKDGIDDCLAYISMSKGTIEHTQCTLINKGGEKIYVSITSTPLKGENGEVIGAIQVLRDITAEKRLNDEIRYLKKFNEDIINSISIGIYVVDKERRIISWNPKMEELTKKNKEEILGNNIFELFDSTSNEYIKDQVTNVFRTENSAFCEGLKVTPDEERTLYLNLAIVPMKDESSLVDKVIVSLDDITNLKETEEKLIMAESLAATGKLAASIAHEVNNPLQGMFSSLKNIEQNLPPDFKERRSLELVDMGLKRVRDIVKRLLNVYRPEHHERGACDVNQVIDEVLSLARHQLRSSGIMIKKELSKDIPKVNASFRQLHQVILNLFLNAQEAMVNGGELIVSTKSIDNKAVIEVVDTGTGIPKEVLRRIFDPFYTTKKKGTGLGLSISYGVIKAHNGDIEVKSEVGKGTTFKILLPV
ncbi:MAG: PAS domain-containing protein [bacterium]